MIDRTAVRWAAASFVAAGVLSLSVQSLSLWRGVSVSSPLPWSLAEPPASSTQRSDLAWARPGVWISQPILVASGAEIHRDPPPRLLGIFSIDGDREAVLLLPDGRRLRVGRGAVLPDGSSIESIGSTQVEWKDREGRMHRQRLLEARTPSTP